MAASLHDNTMTSYLHFWGKAGGARDGGPATHPIAYHGLDVAGAADALIRANPRMLSRVATLLATDPENARRCLVALIALHDIGKFAEAFQWKVPEAWPREVLGDDWSFGDGSHHTEVALELSGRLDLGRLFAPAFEDRGWDDGLLTIWAAVACHHGKPGAEIGEYKLTQSMRSKGERAALAFAADVARLFGPYEALGPVGKHTAERLSWFVAGLTNLADWIGSDRDRFPYQKPSVPLAVYWNGARERADVAVAVSGLLPVSGTSAPQLSQLFPTIAGTASELQQWAQSVELPAGPTLSIIEDVTGSGKTEAALLLAARLMAEDRAGGAFFALPTMATANAMFDRLSESYRRMFGASSEPSLVLAHGRSALHPGFTSSILPGPADVGTDEVDAEAAGDASSAACAAWIADDRRKAFLAHVGVGTIDQAFLGVLPSKHQALRLWGLSDRVLIVDEAHAYDAYMGRELERLLEFQAVLGGSAVVLSATLPTSQREALAKAFARGLGISAPSAIGNAYPLATLVGAERSSATSVGTRVDRARRLPVRIMPSGDVPLAYVADMARRGAAVAWIRNSVDDAIEAFEALQGHELPPEKMLLVHARFAMGDRLAIETRVRERLGKSGTQAGRRGCVVVGTQILEQSLDYDVDVMVTDLAPVDLIIQRAGRLWRHVERTEQGRPVASPELVVVAPDWTHVAERNWYGQVSPRAAAVYKHHGVIWRTAKALAEASAIETPGNVRALIEGVYARGDQQNDDVPEPLRKASNDAIGEHQAHKAHAESNLLQVRAGYAGNNQLWTSDTITPTRLGDPVTVFRLGRIEAGTIVPWCTADDGDLRRSWALSEVSLSRRKAVGVPQQDASIEAIVERAKAAWSKWEQDQPLLLLEGDAEAATGSVVDKDGKPQRVVYGRTAPGMRIVTARSSPTRG